MNLQVIKQTHLIKSPDYNTRTVPKLYLLRTCSSASSLRGTSDWRMYGASTSQIHPRYDSGTTFVPVGNCFEKNLEEWSFERLRIEEYFSSQCRYNLYYDDKTTSFYLFLKQWLLLKMIN